MPWQQVFFCGWKTSISTLRAIARRATVPLAAAVLLASLFLYVWTCGIYYRTLLTPGLTVRLSRVLIQFCAVENGVHFTARMHTRSESPTVQFDSTSYFGRWGYHQGHVLNLGGLQIALLPRRFDGGDFSVLPYFALAVPYWILIGGSACVLAVRTPVSGWIAPHCHWSKASVKAAAIVCLLFVVLNVIPERTILRGWRTPRTFSQRVTQTFHPQSAASDIKLSYGFPFQCYSRGFMDDEPVKLFYGARVGWTPHKAMENVCLAVLAAFLAVLVTEWIRQEFSRPAAPESSGRESL